MYMLSGYNNYKVSFIHGSIVMLFFHIGCKQIKYWYFLFKISSSDFVFNSFTYLYFVKNFKSFFKTSYKYIYKKSTSPEYNR